MSNSTINKINVERWIKENEEFFLPPVCNKLMHNEQLTIMFVGGPNIRKDYHLEEGEEFFYQVKGDMCLKVIEQNQHRDVIIKQGQMFLLPARIPHSPNRFANTVGFVMERRREEKEIDCIRYFKNESTERLYEKWFHTKDLGTELKSVINDFFQSDEYKTGEPKPDSYIKDPPLKNDENAKLEEPFTFSEWIDQHKEELSNGKKLSMFPHEFQTRVYVMSKGHHSVDCCDGDVWLWQHNGYSTAKIITNREEESNVALEPMDSVYLGLRWTCQLNVDDDGLVLAISQDPARKRA